ncbi:MAG: aminotransferase class V-fold PLP-dependent enzyme [Verrucomicrobiaceae bacterium]|nr:aminotransferase class V-fold PLP-dependent enzyme [Verrucomicrobiaceae bacterium]
MKSEFLLAPEIAYLNHGSFGACPSSVFAACQRYQRELELEPVSFLQRYFPEKIHLARVNLARFLNCEADQLAFVRNATYGMNLVAGSLPIGSGDTVLTTDHEYGAVDRMWQTVCRETGAKLKRVQIPLPVPCAQDLVDAVSENLDPSVRVLTFSHITSASSMRFPAEELVGLAANAGIISVIDGAHAPGQLPLEVGKLNADFYVGNCHKWLLSPKGAAFVHVASKWADHIRPPVVSWGNISKGSTALLLENEWQGTADISATLAVSDAIAFLEKHHWFDEVIPDCTRLLSSATSSLLEITGQHDIYGSAELRAPQMASFLLPEGDCSTLHSRLFEEYQVELPVFTAPQGNLFRVSLQAYNTEEDITRLVASLGDLLDNP